MSRSREELRVAMAAAYELRPWVVRPSVPAGESRWRYWADRSAWSQTRKLGVSGRAAAVRRAIEIGELPGG